MYNFDTTFMQRWRRHLFVAPVFGLSIYSMLGFNPATVPWIIGFIAAYLFWQAIRCAGDQFLFGRNIRRGRELNRRIGRGEFEGDGNWR